MTGSDELAKAIAAAAEAGEVTEPAALLAVVRGLTHPILALQKEDLTLELVLALEQDFGFVRFSFTAQAKMSLMQPADERRYAALLRWIIQELRAWRRADDTRYEKLAVLLVVTQICDAGRTLWELLPDDIGGNSDLLSDLQRMAGSFAVQFNAPAGAEVPIWESEALEAFKQADASGDWVAIVRGLQHFRHQYLFPNTLHVQTMRALFRFDLRRLIAALASMRQTPMAVMLAAALKTEYRLRLAIASDNAHIQFAAAHYTLAEERRPAALTAAGQELLSDLLSKVAGDPDRWAAWMKIFAGYSALLLPLGRALATAPESAVRGYIDSFALYPIQVGPDGGRRRSVAECLREFRAMAAPEQRRLLWTYAYERWVQWDFGRADPNQHLVAINWSELDYAVVAYVSECMDDAARSKTADDIRSKMQTLRQHWHASVSDATTNWNRLRSRFQPYAHVMLLAEGGDDWLTETRTYAAFDPNANDYVALMFGQ